MVVNHLTRMKGRRICVAGLDPDELEHVRPVTGPRAALTRSMLRSEGGVFSLGARIDLGPVVPRPSPPEVEDLLFTPGQVRQLEILSADEYLALIDVSCEEDLEEVFGPDLRRDGWTMSLPEGQGNASLGCLMVSQDSEAELGVHFGKVKLRLRAPGRPIYVPVNDLRCYEADQMTPIPRVLKSIQARLSKGVPLRLMVGLTRPYAPDGSDSRHWLQINGICLEDSPLGEVP